MRKLSHMGADADPNANIPLPLEAHTQIAALPDVVALEAEYLSLAESLKEKYGSITKAPESEDLRQRYVRARQNFRSRKESHRTRMLSQLRREFFARKDDALIEAQLNGDDKWYVKRVEPEAPTLSIPERATLASLFGTGDIRSPSMQAQRAAAVQAMADLCRRVEVVRKSA